MASILASLWNEHVLEKPTARCRIPTTPSFANLQKDGTYSVVPRIPGGDHPGGGSSPSAKWRVRPLHPRSPAASASIFVGARVDQLPAIWGELVAAGFETGQAYGKSGAHREVLRGFHLVSLRGAGLHDPTQTLEHRYKGCGHHTS